MLMVIFLFAGTTGKIAGRVVDKSTGEPLIGANVLVKNTLMGASTDIDGYYVILNVSPGEYVLQVSYIGYSNMEISEVKISSDLTTQINIEMGEAALETSEVITVVADKQAIQKDMTATTAIVGSQQIDALPVTEVSEVLALQAGYVDGHVRGGRSGEVAYWIDGIPVTDAYDGETVVDVNKDMVEELQFISGAFNAEYGQAMSGIVNITTKEPSETFGGSFNVYLGDYFSGNSDLFWNTDNFNPLNIYNFDGAIFGVIVPNKLSYFLNTRYIYFGGYYYGKNEYQPHNKSYKDDKTGEWIVSADESALGDGKYKPMQWNRKISGQGKLLYNITPTLKLSYSYIYDNVNYQDYDRAYRLNPDGNLNRFRVGQTHLAKLSHFISDFTFYDIGVSFFQKSYKHYMFEDINDPGYVHPMVGGNMPNYNFKTGGMNNSYFSRKTQTLLAKFDLSSQISTSHFLKGGVEFRKNTMDFDDIQLKPIEGDNINYETGDPFMTPYIPSISGPFHSKYSREPIQFSGYLQDKMEFEDIIVNVGFRYDYFEPDGKYLADPSDPNIYNPIKPENRYHDIDGDGILDIDAPKTVAEREKYWYKKSSVKQKISPRLGVSFPVTETGVVHFSYGHFFQIPNFEFLYQNPQYKLDTGTGNIGTIGNSDLKPEQTISGEIGYKQELPNGILIDVTAYFRDIRDLVGTRADEIEIEGGAATYSRLINSDFGLIKGVIISLKSRYGLGLNYTVDYTFQIAEGTASDPDQARNAYAAGNRPEVQLLPLAWDQRHTVNITLGYRSESWGGSLIGTYGSGLPYTPRKTSDVSEFRENSESKPPTTNVDLRLYKDFNIFNMKLTLFARAFNLFDTLNETNVYDDTGRAGYTTDLATIKSQNPEMLEGQTLEDWFNDETFYSEPRRIEFGMKIHF
jgi:outer membrane receptor protein involved in Fe transport